jgi:hypothetical protein
VQDGKPLQGIRDDETPWCATFVSAVLELESIPSTRSAWARSYLNWATSSTRSRSAPSRCSSAARHQGTWCLSSVAPGTNDELSDGEGLTV